MAQDDNRDDLEFATKEDLEEIAKNPALQKIYNAMKAGVTKKFQTFGEERRTLVDNLTRYQDTLQKWEEWRPIIDSIIQDGGLDNSSRDDGRGGRDEDRGRGDDRDTRRGDGRGRRGRGGEDDSLIDTLKGYVRREDVEKVGRDMAGELASMRRMLDLSLQLDDIYRTHLDKRPGIKFDRQKVLQTALERNYGNLEDAYTYAYRDDFIKEDVDTKVNARVEEELAKRRVPGETGGGTTPVSFKLPDSLPKSFSEATSQALTEHSAGTLNPAEKK
jgi:hypothetical protein